jgi:Trypsin
MRILLGLMLFISPSFAIYKGTEEKGHSGYSRYLVSSELEGKHHCTGMLIAKDIIITTAMCAMEAPSRHKWFYRTKTGHKTELALAHSLLHPQYDPTKSYWTVKNIALLRLARPINSDFDELYKNLTTFTYFHDNQVTIAGFGRTENENALSAGVYRSATFPLANTIHSYYEAAQHLQSAIVSADAPIPSVCSGDHGGGLFAKKDNKDVLIGMLIGQKMPRDTMPNTCGGQSLINHLGNVKQWIEKSVDVLRAREIVR